MEFVTRVTDPTLVLTGFDAFDLCAYRPRFFSGCDFIAACSGFVGPLARDCPGVRGHRAAGLLQNQSDGLIQGPSTVACLRRE